MSEPRSMVAVTVAPEGLLTVDRREIPQPDTNEALVRIEYGGICGSDLHYWLHGAAGESVLQGPMVLGHEVSGVVVMAAMDGSGPAVNSAVVIHPAVGATGDEPSGYLGSAARWPHTDGAFARYVSVPTKMLRDVPDGVSLREAVIAEPAAVALHAVGKAVLLGGERALVVGCGPIGLLTIAALQRAGIEQICAMDLHREALERAVMVGATSTVLAAESGSESNAFDVVFEASGGAAGLRAAIRLARRQGRVIMVGLLPPGEQPVPVSEAIGKELQLIGSFRFGEEISEVLTALADGTLSVDGVITHEFAVADSRAGFEMARDSRESGKVLVRFNEVSDDPTESTDTVAH